MLIPGPTCCRDHSDEAQWDRSQDSRLKKSKYWKWIFSHPIITISYPQVDTHTQYTPSSQGNHSLKLYSVGFCFHFSILDLCNHFSLECSSGLWLCEVPHLPRNAVKSNIYQVPYEGSCLILISDTELSQHIIWKLAESPDDTKKPLWSLQWVRNITDKYSALSWTIFTDSSSLFFGFLFVCLFGFFKKGLTKFVWKGSQLWA